MQREFSAGGAVVRHMQQRWWLAVIEPSPSSGTDAAAVTQAPSTPTKRSRHRNPSRTVLALPKGLIDPGEKPPQTAVREVREETGVDAALITKLKDIKYFYIRSWGDKQRVFKVVSFYLLLYRAGQLDDITPEMRREVKQALWIPLEEAPQKLAYPGERQIAKAALDYISAHPEISESHAADTAR